tara:strand:- start:337 stop:636 length:300 start_codon:yes stop_codon:yes gene_type:complete
MSSLLEFNHSNAAINNFVQLLLSRPSINNRAQLILMSGVALNNVELITAASQIEPGIAGKPVSPAVLNIIDSIFSAFTGIHFGTARSAPAVSSNSSAPE